MSVLEINGIPKLKGLRKDKKALPVNSEVSISVSSFCR